LHRTAASQISLVVTAQPLSRSDSLPVRLREIHRSAATREPKIPQRYFCKSKLNQDAIYCD